MARTGERKPTITIAVELQVTPLIWQAVTQMCQVGAAASLLFTFKFVLLQTASERRIAQLIGRLLLHTYRVLQL